MNKKGVFPLIAAIILIAVLIGGGAVYYYYGPLSQTSFSDPAYKLIPNTNDPNLPYTEKTNAASYTCTGADECIVWGSMDVTQSQVYDTVVFRTNAKDINGYNIDYQGEYNYGETCGIKKFSNGQSAPSPSCTCDTWDVQHNCLHQIVNSHLEYEKTWIAIRGLIQNNQFISTSDLHVYVYYSSTGGSRTTQINIPTLYETRLYIYNSVIYVEIGNTLRKYVLDDVSYPWARDELKPILATYSETNGAESSNRYQANFNFCPANNTNNPFCSGSSNSVSGASAKIHFTNAVDTTNGEVRLSSNAGSNTITFNPKYPDGTSVESKTLFIKKGDGTCADPKNTCDSTTTQCQQCPAGYTATSSLRYCKNNDYIYNKPYCYKTGTDSSYSVDCFEQYTSYWKCDGTHLVGNYGGSCNWWKTEVTCDTGNKCYLGTTGTTTGVGLGSCRCAADQCGSGDVKTNTDGTFQLCTKTGSGCWIWDPAIKQCLAGLSYSSTLKKCVCDPNNVLKCDSSTTPKKCDGISGFKKCEDTIIVDNIFTGSRTCQVWGSTNACVGGTSCDGTTGNCVCLNNECALGNIKCDGSNKYFTCNIYGINLCPTWGTSVGVPTGKQCTSNKLESLPGCTYNNPACGADYDCVSNQCVAKTTGDYCAGSEAATCVDATHVKACVSVGSGIFKWQTTTAPADKTCVSGVFFCKTTGDYCSQGTAATCVDVNNLKSCNKVGDCYKWVNTIAPTDYYCNNGAFSVITTGDYCTTTQPDTCASSTQFKHCTQISGSVYKWITSNCPTATQCANGVCNPVGCQYNTPGMTCDTANFESCINNQCVCKQDDNTCAAGDYTNSNKRCSLDNNNAVQSCVKHNNCYRWENSISCDSNHQCVASGTTASCIVNFKDVKIDVDDNFGINQKIIAYVLVSPNVGSVANIPVRASMYDASDNIIPGTTLTNPITDSTGKAILNFNYASAKIQDITIKVTVGDPAGINYKTSTLIHVLATLGVQLNCPTIGYVGREVSCSWIIKDLDTGLQQDIAPSITVVQGINNIDYVPTKTSLTYTYSTNKVVNVITTVTANKNGYISDTKSATTTIQMLTQTQSLLVNGKGSDTYQDGISTGVNAIEIKVDEIGVPADVQEIDAVVTTPANQKIPLTFMKVSTGDFKANYNFLQTGMTYIIDGTVIFTDETKASIPFSYSLSTVSGGGGGGGEVCKILWFFSSSATSDLCGQYNMIAWGLFFGIIGVIVTIIIIVRVTRRK